MYRYIIILRLADALIVMDSRLVIRVENMVTTCTCRIPRDLYTYMYVESGGGNGRRTPVHKWRCHLA